MTEIPEILFIDDDEDDRLLFGLAMQQIGTDMSYGVAKDVESIRSLINDQNRPKIIFLDLNLPLTSGLDFLKDLYNGLLTSHIQIIIFTTSVNPLDKERSMELGASGFLKKPSDFEEMCRMMEEVITDIRQ